MPTGLPLTDQANALIEVGRGVFLRLGLGWLEQGQRIARQEPNQFGSGRRPQRLLLGSDDGGESHGGLLSCCQV